MFTRDSIEQQCLADYAEHAGKVVLARSFRATINHDSHDIDLEEPIRVRVWDKMDENAVISWTGEFCDPFWDVELLEPHDVLDAASSVWIDGISRNVDGKVEHPSGWKIDENQHLSRYYVEQQCMASYQEHAGKFLLVNILHGHLDDCNQEFIPSRPVRVRVVEHQRESDVLEWHEAEDIHDTDWCAPYWDVELAEPPFDNETEYADLCSHLWVHAPHMTIMGDWSEIDDWKLDPNQAPLTGDAARDMPAVLTTPDRAAAEAAIKGVLEPKRVDVVMTKNAADGIISCPHCGQPLHLTIERAK